MFMSIFSGEAAGDADGDGMFIPGMFIPGMSACGVALGAAFGDAGIFIPGIFIPGMSVCDGLGVA